MGISGGEIILVILVILVFFGADKIPELVRSYGKGMNEIKKATAEIKRELTSTVDDLRQDANDMVRDVQTEVRSVGKEIKDLEGFDPYRDVTSDADVTTGTKESNGNSDGDTGEATVVPPKV